MKTSIGRDALKISISKATVLAISMASAVLLSRYRTLEEYGTYSQIILVISLAISLFTLGLPNSINYFIVRANTKVEKQVFLSTYYSLNTILSIIMGLALLIATPILVNYFENSQIRAFLFTLAVLPWAKVIYSSLGNLLVVYHKTTMLMIVNIANSISLLGIILVVQWLHMTFNHYMLIYALVESLFALIVYVVVWQLEGKISFSVDWRLIRPILVFSVPLGLAAVVGTINLHLDALMIAKFFDTENFAIYTNAGKEMPVTIISASLTAVLMPRLVHLMKDKKNTEAVRLWGNATKLSYIFLCFFATGLFVFAPQVISLLYSDKFLPGVTVFRIYSLVLLLRVTYFGMVLNSIGKTKFIFYSSLASLGLNVVLNYVCYKLFGFPGPAIATVISMTLISLLQLAATAKNINFPFRKIFPWRSLSVITLVNLLFGASFYIIQKYSSLDKFTSAISEMFILAGIWTILYVLVVFRYVKSNWKAMNQNDSSILSSTIDLIE